jgi:DNA helicase HerA-like ATPase
VRSKGVGVFFVTQSPKDVPPAILGQLGHRVQHALRAFTADDDKALKAAARTFPKTEFYDLEETMTTLGIGEALVTVLGPSGVPTAPVATRLIPPASRMGPLTDAELQQRLAASKQVQDYAQAIDRESAREMLAARMVARPDEEPEAKSPARRSAAEPPSTFEQVLKSPLTRSLANTVARGLLGALLGPPPRRRRRSSYF